MLISMDLALSGPLGPRGPFGAISGESLPGLRDPAQEGPKRAIWGPIWAPGAQGAIWGHIRGVLARTTGSGPGGAQKGPWRPPGRPLEASWEALGAILGHIWDPLFDPFWAKSADQAPLRCQEASQGGPNMAIFGPLFDPFLAILAKKASERVPAEAYLAGGQIGVPGGAQNDPKRAIFGLILRFNEKGQILLPRILRFWPLFVRTPKGPFWAILGSWGPLGALLGWLYGVLRGFGPYLGPFGHLGTPKRAILGHFGLPGGQIWPPGAHIPPLNQRKWGPSGRGAPGGPKGPKRAILGHFGPFGHFGPYGQKGSHYPYQETGYWPPGGQKGPFGPKMTHFGPFWAILGHFGPSGANMASWGPISNH